MQSHALRLPRGACGRGACDADGGLWGGGGGELWVYGDVGRGICDHEWSGGGRIGGVCGRLEVRGDGAGARVKGFGWVGVEAVKVLF